MKARLVLFGFVLAWPWVCLVSGSTFFVNLNSSNPQPPYSSWGTAATNIQNAVDLSANGDFILVTNGVYAAGGRVAGGLTTNRLAITTAVTVQSVNGPAVTVIQGYQVPGTTNGLSAVRCAYLTNGAVLSGFSLQGGATRADGTNGYGGGVNCQSTGATVSNCVLVGNAAVVGGGSVFGTVNNSTFSNNVAQYAGGAYAGTFNNFLFTGNSAGTGGAVAAPMESTTVLNNCTVCGNSASTAGGGLASIGEAAPSFLVATNCIAYGNQAPSGSNYVAAFASELIMSYCCTTPLPAGGTNNFTNNPIFVNAAAGDYQLQSNSPCINAGTATAALATDLDGNLRVVGGFVDLGAYEYQVASSVPLIPSLQADYTGVSTGIVVNFTGQIAGHATASQWTFGDGTAVSNQLPSVAHSWAVPGNYTVALWAYNASYTNGVSTAVTIHVLANPVHYVSQNSSNPVAPYLSWNTAATNLQDAVNAAYVAGTVVVSNGVYACGGQTVTGLTGTLQMNRVLLSKQLVLRSVNGPAAAVIEGTTANDTGPVRCVYLAANTVLAGFTLTNGQTHASGYVNDVTIQSGGGAFCESGVLVTNCVLTGNSAYIQGGGAYGGTLVNCWFVSNSVAAGEGGGACGNLQDCILVGNYAYDGGGAFGSTLNNCTLVGNTALYYGGGASASTLNNCILLANAAGSDPDYDFEFLPCTLNYCCASLFSSSGPGNLTNNPAFVNQADSDFHLQPSSPCINTGDNALVIGATDFDGNPRIQGGTVDLGAYEFQSQVTGTFAAWLQQFGLPADGSANAADSDGTGMPNWEKWIAGLNPTNHASVLVMLAPAAAGHGTEVPVSWQSVNTRTYYLQRAMSLNAGAFSTIQTNLAGWAGTTTYTDNSATNGGPYFYRVGVQ